MEPMSISSKDIIPLSRARVKREHIRLHLLQEAIKGLDDLEAGKTLTLAQMKSKHGG